MVSPAPLSVVLPSSSHQIPPSVPVEAQSIFVAVTESLLIFAATTALSASFAAVTASSARLAALMLPLNSLYKVSKLELISELEIVVLPLNVFGLFTIEILLSSFFVLMSFYHSCFNCLMVLVSSSDFFLALYS